MAYLVVMAVDLPAILSQLHWTSDFSASMVLAESWARLPGGRVLTASGSGQSSLATVGFEVLTATLPGHREAWLVAPSLMSLAGAALLAYATARLAGAWAGVMTLAISVCAAPVLLEVLVGQNDHGLTQFDIALLAALLVMAHGRSDHRAASLGLGAAVGGAVTGITLASDLLVGLVGVVPFLVAPLLLLALRRGRREAVLAGWAVALVAVAVTTAYGLTRLMRHWGFHVPDGVPGGLASLDQARRNAGILVTQLLELGNANLVAQPLGPALVPMAVLAMAVVGGLAVVLLRPAALARASAARAPGRPGTDAELVYVVFWAVSVGLLLVAFVGSTVPVNNTAVRYLGAVFAAVAACVPLAARSSPARRRGIALAVALFCAASAWSVHDRTQREAFRLPHTKDLPQVIALLDARGLRRGYSTYWDANAVTWQTGGRIQIAAVVENPTDVAPFRPNSIDAWYDGTAPEPTFFLVDPDPLVMAAPPGDRLPPPDEIIPVGRFTVLVYRDDIAARFAP